MKTLTSKEIGLLQEINELQITTIKQQNQIIEAHKEIDFNRQQIIAQQNKIIEDQDVTIDAYEEMMEIMERDIEIMRQKLKELGWEYAVVEVPGHNHNFEI